MDGVISLSGMRLRSQSLVVGIELGIKTTVKKFAEGQKVS